MHIIMYTYDIISGIATLRPTGALALPSASVVPPSTYHVNYQFAQNYRLANS